MDITNQTAGRGSGFSVVILPNGLRLVYEKPVSILPITSIHAFVHLGSVNEDEHTHGVSHIIEHMAFKGTPTLPKPYLIAKPFDDTGAYINAYTDKQYTCYVVKCQNDYVRQSIQVLADMLFHSIFQKTEYIKEYDVVIEEAKLSADDIYDTMYNTMDAAMYKGSSYENPIDHLLYHQKYRISNETATQIYKSYYVPENMVISIISTIPFSTILGFVKKSYFASVAAVAAATAAATTQRRSPNLYLEPFRETQYIIEKRRGYETVNVAVGFRVCNMFSPDKNRLNFVKYILVGPVRSRFVRILRDENGLTYKTSINIDYYEHAGDFTIYTQVDSNKLVKNSTNRGKGLLPILFRILHDIYQNGITADEFKTAKGYLKGILARNLEDNNTLAEHNGKSVLFYNENDVYSYSKKYEVCYKDITREEINAVIRKYFIAENMCVYMNGEGLPSLNTIKRIVETAGFIPLNN